jgi:hypothetical protein
MRETCGRWTLLLALTAACSSSPLPPEPGTPPQKSSPQPMPSSSSRCDQAPPALPEVESLTWPAPLEVHLTGVVDAMNLGLDVDGTFRLLVDGCDFGDCVVGAWTLVQDAIVLTPGEGESAFDWPPAGRAAAVRLTRDSPTSLRAEVPSGSFDAGIWAAGLVCPECCGGLGPSGLHACAGPLPASCPD